MAFAKSTCYRPTRQRAPAQWRKALKEEWAQRTGKQRSRPHRPRHTVDEYRRIFAVIGASRRRGTIGGEALRNLVSYGFEGPVFPVNPNTPVVQSIVVYPTVEEVPGAVDLAVLIVPADRVLQAAEACGRKGVRALVVISAGFAETGAEGRARQEGLVRVCRAAGMRLIGPNCMGIVNTAPAVRLNATFAPVPPTVGRKPLRDSCRPRRSIVRRPR